MDKVTLKSFGKDECYCEWFECSFCGDSMITDESNFCPNCGKPIQGRCMCDCHYSKEKQDKNAHCDICDF